MLKCGTPGDPSDEIESFLQHICEATGRSGFPVCEIPGDRPRLPVPRYPEPPSREGPPKRYLSPAPTHPDRRPPPPKREMSPAPVPKKVPVPQLCCFNPETSSLVCEGTPYDGLIVELITRTTLPNGMEVASVSHPSIPGGGARVPVCPEGPPQRRPIPKRQPPRRVPPPQRDPPKRTPPPRRDPPAPVPKRLPTPSFLPDDVCYNMETGQLEAEGTKWHGLAVHPISIGAIKDGRGMILVEHANFVAGRASVPICGGSCYAGSEPGRAYAMTYWGTPHKSDGSIRRYSGFSGDPSVISEQRRELAYLNGRNRSFLPNSPGPNIHLLHQANIPISPWGPVGHAHPPNVTGNPAGYNTKLFQTDGQVVDVLAELGYAAGRGEQKFDFGRAVAQFQSDYNALSNSIPAKRELQNVNWVRVPKGHVVADGMVGPVTMNAMEVALVNQRGGIPWEQAILLMVEAARGYPPKTHVYDARQKDLGRRNAQEPIGPRGISRRR